MAVKTDYALLLAVVLLVLLGLMMIYSATFTLRRDSGYFLKRQILWATLGFALLTIVARVDYHLWQYWALPIMSLSFLSLVAVLLGRNSSSAASWLREGSIQPSEFAKLAFVVYIAAWLASKGDKIRDVTYGLIPFAVLLGCVTGLILLQPDVGTAVLIAATAMAMFFIAGAETSQLFISLLIGGVALYAVIVNFGYAHKRIQFFFNPGIDPQGVGYQITSVLSALREGGLIGRGLGAGTHKFLPPFVHHTDTIFSVIGEELGLLGCLIIVGLFLFIAYRGLVISFRALDTFGALLAFGVTYWIVFQAMVHVAVNTSILPFTGLTLPFVSYGGSSLTMSLAGVGLLLSVAHRGTERELRSSAAFAFGRRNRRPRLSGASRRRGIEKGRMH